MITNDILDDDSSLELNNRGNNVFNNNVNNGQIVEFMTPEKKKKYKYYS